MTTAEVWMIVLNIVWIVITASGVVVAFAAQKKRTDVELSNPYVKVQVMQELHEKFAGRHEFDAHVGRDAEEHGKIHQRLDEAIADYNEKFQSLPNEIVALLRNTGNLRGHEK